MKKIKEILKIFKIFSFADIFSLFFLTFLTAFLEIAGIVSVVPLISFLFYEEKIFENNNIIFLINYFDFLNQNNFIYFLAINIIFFNILINFFILFNQYTINKLCWKNQFKINNMLFNDFFSKKFYNILESNIVTFRQLCGDVDAIRTGIIASSLTIISRIFTILFILIFISYVNFIITLTIFFVILLFYIIFYKSISSIIKKNSIKNLESITDRIRVMADIINSYKQLKVMSLYSNFAKHYHNQFEIIKKIDIKNKLLSVLPRHLIEPIFISFFIIILLTLKLEKNYISIESYFAILYAFYRIVPAFQNIYGNYSTIKKYYPVYQNLITKLNFETINKSINTEKNQEKKLVVDKIKIQNFSFKYHSSNQIFENQVVEFKKNSSYFIEGVNGSGKTTLIDILMLLLKPQAGNILVNDKEISESDYDLYQKNFSYTPQRNHIFETTLEKNISLEIDYNKINNSKIESLVRFFEFNDMFENLKNNQNYLFSAGKNLSGGQAQRIGILRSLYFDKEILVFDEATSQIDEESEVKILKKILSLNEDKIIIFVSHNSNLKKYFSHVVNIVNSVIVSKKND